MGRWRKVNIPERKTMVDWAHEIKELLDIDYPYVKKIRLLCDNLNTHKIASLYEAFEPQETRRLAQRLEIHYMPKHGRWLNVAEIELSALTNQCLKRRIPDLQTLKDETKFWERDRNANQKSVDWHFTTDDARTKLNVSTRNLNIVRVLGKFYSLGKFPLSKLPEISFPSET